jgi:curli production assembly/transport component CsgF
MRILSTAVFVCFAGTSVCAGDLIYQPVSPAFGGNPLNSTFLLQTAEIQNRYAGDGGFGDLFDEPSLADEFADALRNTLVSISAGELIDAVVQREDATGTIDLDGATVRYETVDGRVIVTINDGVTTNVLDLPIPVN